MSIVYCDNCDAYHDIDYFDEMCTTEEFVSEYPEYVSIFEKHKGLWACIDTFKNIVLNETGVDIDKE